MVSSPYYDDLDLPINPIAPIPTQEDNMPHSIGILNWINDEGNLEFRPRLREANSLIDGGRAPGLEHGFSVALNEDAPEIDVEYDCD